MVATGLGEGRNGEWMLLDPEFLWGACLKSVVVVAYTKNHRMNQKKEEKQVRIGHSNMLGNQGPQLVS